MTIDETSSSAEERLLRKEAQRRGWTVVRADRAIGIVGVPCFLAPDTPGRCEVWVGVDGSEDTLACVHTWQGPHVHVANIRGLTTGAVYARNGEVIGNVILRDGDTSCTISIIRDAGYDHGWQALKTYVNEVYGGFRGSKDSPPQVPDRPYRFEIRDERSEMEVEWLDLIRAERVAVVGLGGLGSWIADVIAKCDVHAVTAWDGDIIEPKNLIRMPGAGQLEQWIGRHKTDWFETTYSSLRTGIAGRAVMVDQSNVHEVLAGTSFAFLAVDNDTARATMIEALAGAHIPFIDVGTSIDRRQTKVSIALRLVVARPYSNSWRGAIPRVDTAGQQIYGSIELPDVGALTAGWAVQLWRQYRGQVTVGMMPECVVYRAESHQTAVRSE